MCMADRPVLGSREQLVAQLFVEPGRLESEALEIRVAAAALDRAPLRRLQESPAVASAAQRLGYPQDSHVEHAAQMRPSTPPMISSPWSYRKKLTGEYAVNPVTARL